MNADKRGWEKISALVSWLKNLQTAILNSNSYLRLSAFICGSNSSSHCHLRLIVPAAKGARVGGIEIVAVRVSAGEIPLGQERLVVRLHARFIGVASGVVELVMIDRGHVRRLDTHAGIPDLQRKIGIGRLHEKP